MQHRLIVVPVIRNDAGACFLIRMPPNRGAYPGQWGLPGGGVEPGEQKERLDSYDLNEATVDTLRRAGLLAGVPP